MSRWMCLFVGLQWMCVFFSLALGSIDACAECLRSLSAAREAHPTAHLTWSGGCYRQGYPAHRRRQSYPAQRRLEVRHVPLPMPRAFARASLTDIPPELHAAAVAPPWALEERFQVDVISLDEQLAAALLREAAALRIVRILMP